MTMMSRRRFLMLTVSTVAAPASALPTDHVSQWSGTAMGADVSMSFHNPFGAHKNDVSDIVSLLREVERTFSLFDPNSSLSRLNSAKTLVTDDRFEEVMAVSQSVYEATDGLFDPTIQTVWSALARGQSPDNAWAHVGFDQVKWTEGVICLDPFQSLSFNGIAQGYATDVVRAELSARGYKHVLINMGEYSAQGGPFTLGVQDPKFGQLGTVSIQNTSVATSSPSASNSRDHIFHPKGGQTQWSTVSVEATSATLADACSTVFCMMSRAEIASVKRHFDLGRILLIDADGNLSTI